MSYLVPDLWDHDWNEDQSEYTVDCCPPHELKEELERCLSHNASNPTKTCQMLYRLNSNGSQENTESLDGL